MSRVQLRARGCRSASAQSLTLIAMASAKVFVEGGGLSASVLRQITELIGRHIGYFMFARTRTTRHEDGFQGHA